MCAAKNLDHVEADAPADAAVDFADFAPYFERPRSFLRIAQDERRSPAARLAALGDMATSVDELFAAHCEELRRALVAADALALAPTGVTTRYVTPLLDQAAGEFVDTILPLLADALTLVDLAALSAAERDALHTIFLRDYFPLLTPLAVDPAHPFPRLGHGTLNLLVQLRTFAGDSIIGGTLFAVLSIPPHLPRWICVPRPRARSVVRLVWIEDLLTHFIDHFFSGVDIIHVYLFRVLRCTPSGGGHLQGEIVRLDIGAPVPLGVATWLANHLHLPTHTVVRNRPPLAMADLRSLSAYLPAVRPRYQRAAIRLWDFFFGHV